MNKLTLFVYLSYDNESAHWVHFDELKISHTESLVLQVNACYPFGLMAYTWLRDGEKENLYGYQGKEYDSLTRWHDFHARQYDGALGRMWSMDPKNQFASCYIGMGNNPVMMIDPDGQWAGWDDLIVSAVGFVYGYVSSGIQTGDWGKKSLIQGGISAALFELGYLTGGGSAGLTASSSNAAIATAGARYAAQSVATGVVSQLMPSVPIYQSDNFSLSASPAFAWGTNGLRAGASLNASAQLGDTQISGSISGYRTWKDFGSGSKGWNLQAGYGISQTIGNNTYSLYNTVYRGTDKTFNQRVGGLGYYNSKGDFGFRFEDDWIGGGGVLGDGGDRYRTAALQFQYRSYVAGFRVFTGNPDDGIGNRLRYFNSYRLGGRYSEGVLYAGIIRNGQLYTAGWNSSGIKQTIQNTFHSLIGSPYFIDPVQYSRPYFNYSSYNPFSLY